MSTRKTATRGKGKGKGRDARSDRNVVPEVYQEMLADALPMQSDVPERPLKKRRMGPRRNSVPVLDPGAVVDSGDEEDLQFEDVPLPESDELHKQQQTAYRESDDESEESEFDWEAVNLDFDTKPVTPSGDLELNLSSRPTPQRRTTTPRRKVVSKEDRALRLQIHKLHMLCLLSYIDRRNHWCSDYEIQKSLKRLLSKKMLTYLRPNSTLSQFGQAESLKRGLEDVSQMWRARYNITTRGMRRALWADSEGDLQNFKLPADADTCLDKSDFRAAAKELKGSRDLGAQLYCALLRSAGVEARLVCSLQLLSFTGGGPAMPRSSISNSKAEIPEASDEGESDDIHGTDSSFPNAGGPSSSTPPFSARRRLGHPNAADYHMPDIRTPVIPSPKAKVKQIHESAFPVFWVEVLDEAHQKWFPVDPLVTATVAKPRAFEPPAADRENSMSYVIAFEDEGTARDVTRRYTKAYNAKTRRDRVDCTTAGKRWWNRAMRHYSRGWKSDLDQIEDTELAAAEAREPMPKNIADFKDHPFYALKRHLRRNEVLVSDKEVGKVGAGRDSTTPGLKKLEGVFRRRDVKVVKSAESWYRLGREVKIGEQPTKTVEAKRKADDDELGDDQEERAGTNLYTEEQTEPYEAPPIVNGRVPKNSYGNLDIYVPSMVPKGGIHLPYDEASRAARILGIDYADALTGFEFRGRHGTAILKGIVVAIEYREAVEAVVEGFRDERAQAEEEERALHALRMWKRFLVGLRIKRRVDSYRIEGEDSDGLANEDDDDDDLDTLDSEEYIDDDEGGGGGFFPE